MYRSGEQQYPFRVRQAGKLGAATNQGGLCWPTRREPSLQRLWQSQIETRYLYRPCAASPHKKQPRRRGTIPTIQELLHERLKFEELAADEAVYCESCQARRQMDKWCEITSPPSHLCISMSRFAWDRETQTLTKVKTKVRVDGGITIGPYQYDLYCTIMHRGESATEEHILRRRAQI